MSDAVPGLPAAFTLVALDATGSTQDDAKALAADGAAHLTLVWARSQQAGRGRFKRAWASPPGNLYTSTLLRPGPGWPPPGTLSFAVALAVHDTVAGCLPAGPPVTMKWPNDILVGGAKISGVLIETAGSGGGAPDWVVIGAGINVAHHPPAQDTTHPATDLQAAGAGATLESVLAAYAAALERRLETWVDGGFPALRAEVLARMQGIGAAIAVALPDRRLTGTFAGLDSDGALLLAGPDGDHRRITAGDVFGL